MLQYLVFLAEINWVLWIYFSLHNLLLIFCIFLSCFLDFASAWFTIQLFFYCCICLFISLSSNPGSWANVLSLSNSLSLWYFKYTTFNFSIFLAMKCRSFFILKLCPGILLNLLILIIMWRFWFVYIVITSLNDVRLISSQSSVLNRIITGLSSLDPLCILTNITLISSLLNAYRK